MGIIDGFGAAARALESRKRVQVFDAHMIVRLRLSAPNNASNTVERGAIVIAAKLNDLQKREM